MADGFVHVLPTGHIHRPDDETPCPGRSVARFQLGQRVRSNIDGSYGIIERRRAQSYTDDLYRVIWDHDAADHDWYPEGHLQ